MTLHANWKDHLESIPTNEEGNQNSGRYTNVSLGTDQPRETRLLKLTQSFDNVVLFANNRKGIELAHNGTNMGGTLGRSEDKIVFLLGSGTRPIAIEFCVDSLLKINPIIFPEIGAITSCETRAEFAALAAPDQESEENNEHYPNYFVAAPFLSSAILNEGSRDCFDLIRAVVTSATAFDEAHEDNEAAHSAMAHASAFVKFAFAVSKGLIKETQFSIKPEDGEIEAYLQSRLRNCILPPLDQSDGLGGGAANGALQQLAQSVSMHAESSNASNQVRIRELNAAEKRAEEKKDRLSKFQAGTLNMISMASSTDFMRKGEITPTLREFINSDSAAIGHQNLLTQFKTRGNNTVAFSPGTLQSIWHGNFQQFNENTPSNFSIFTIMESNPGQNDGMDRIYLHLVAASKQQHVSLESLKASTIQVTSTPSNYDELIERVMSFSQWYALTFGDKSSGAEGLVSLHSKLVLQKGLLRSRFEADPTYGAKICYAVDTRVNIHLKQCEVADDREDVDDSVVTFDTLVSKIQTNEFSINLPTCFKSSKDPKDDNKDSLLAAKTLLSLGGGGGGGGGGGARKRKKMNERVPNEDQHEDLKLLSNETWNLFTGKEVETRPKWGNGTKRMCPRWHIQGSCFTDCNNHESHVGKNDIPLEKVNEMKAWLRRVRRGAS